MRGGEGVLSRRRLLLPLGGEREEARPRQTAAGPGAGVQPLPGEEEEVLCRRLLLGGEREEARPRQAAAEPGAGVQPLPGEARPRQAAAELGAGVEPLPREEEEAQPRIMVFRSTVQAAAEPGAGVSPLLGEAARPRLMVFRSTEQAAAGPGAGVLPLPGEEETRPRLMVFRSTEQAAAGPGAGVLPLPGEEEEEKTRPRLMVFRSTVQATPGAGVEPLPGQGAPSLELALGALGLRGASPGGGGGCPCEETSDALLVLEAAPEFSSSSSSSRRREEGEAEEEERPEGSRRRRGPPPGRKGSLRLRISRIFRTKSCTGTGGGGGERRGNPTAGELGGGGGSLTDMSRDRELELGRKPRLTRTQSAFSPVSFSPLFTGETVSLVDVDISQRGSSCMHPPTPPPPPRRSLSLLDDISGIQPASVLVGPMGSSLQSFPLPPPPPPHAPDPFPRLVPLRPAESVPVSLVQPLQYPLYRQDSSTFAASLRELEKCGWYWGPMNWEDAEMKLKGKADGSFLVRDSSDPRYILSLSFRSQGITHHTRMEHYRGTFSLWCHPKFEDRCQSVVEFIKRAIMHSKNGKFLYFLRSRVPGLPPTPVQLLYPVSRFSNVKSLQHLCRFRIRQLVRIDHIPALPLPKPLIFYLRKFYYYDPQEEVYLCLKEARRVPTTEPGNDGST